MRLSVIVPVHNAAGYLDQCLGSLARSEFRDFDCCVVDDGSSDDCAQVAARYGAAVVVLERQGGPARARNRGATHAAGDVVVFLDADVCVHPDTLGRIAAHFHDHPQTVALIGSYDDRPAAPGLVSQYKNLLHHYTHQVSRPEAWTFWAGCGAVRRAVFAEMGGFDETYRRPSVEDIELGFRMRAAGHRIDLRADVQVTHLKRWTLWSVVRTDVRDRGVPWFMLMLRDRTMPPDLNVGMAHRLSVVLVFTMVLGCAAVLVDRLTQGVAQWRVMQSLLRPAAIGAVAAAGGLWALNYDLYRFFARRRGLRFAAGGLLLHWLYYFYCGLAVLAATGMYGWRRAAGTASLGPSGPPAMR